MIEPLGDRVIIRRQAAEEKLASGLYAPAEAAEAPLEGVVVSVGGGKYSSTGDLIPMRLKAGDKVAFGQYAGSDVSVEGETYLVCREEEILGVFR